MLALGPVILPSRSAFSCGLRYIAFFSFVGIDLGGHETGKGLAIFLGEIFENVGQLVRFRGRGKISPIVSQNLFSGRNPMGPIFVSSGSLAILRIGAEQVATSKAFGRSSNVSLQRV